jgi:hypothetical protein
MLSDFVRPAIGGIFICQSEKKSIVQKNVPKRCKLGKDAQKKNKNVQTRTNKMPGPNRQPEHSTMTKRQQKTRAEAPGSYQFSLKFYYLYRVGFFLQL